MNRRAKGLKSSSRNEILELKIQKTLETDTYHLVLDIL